MYLIQPLYFKYSFNQYQILKTDKYSPKFLSSEIHFKILRRTEKSREKPILVTVNYFFCTKTHVISVNEYNLSPIN